MFKGKFGYYSCNKETYLKVKSLRKWYFKSIRDAAKHERWERKQPQNRVIRQHIRDEKGNKCGSTIIGPAPEPKYCWKILDPRINSTFDFIRKPCAYEKDVRHLPKISTTYLLSIDDINGLYFSLKSEF